MAEHELCPYVNDTQDGPCRKPTGHRGLHSDPDGDASGIATVGVHDHGSIWPAVQRESDAMAEKRNSTDVDALFEDVWYVLESYGRLEDSPPFPARGAIRSLARLKAEFEGHRVCEANMDAEVERLRAERSGWEHTAATHAQNQLDRETDIIRLRAELEHLRAVVSRCDEEMDRLNSALAEEMAEVERLRQEVKRLREFVQALVEEYDSGDMGFGRFEHFGDIAKEARQALEEAGG